DMPGEKPVLGTQKQGETNERQRDGRPGAPYIEGERKRQIVALPEAVRGGGSGSGEAENKRQASEELAPAPRHNRHRGRNTRYSNTTCPRDGEAPAGPPKRCASISPA